MRKAPLAFVLAALLFLAAPAEAGPLLCSSNELLAAPEKYDGKEIAYRGEVVGDIMWRGDHAWVAVNDGMNAIS